MIGITTIEEYFPFFVSGAVFERGAHSANYPEDWPEMRAALASIDLAEDANYRNPPEAQTAGIRVFEPDQERFFLPNRTVLVDLILHRDPRSRVFKIKKP